MKKLKEILKEIFVFRWQPKKDLLVVLLSYVLVVTAVYAANHWIGAEAWGGMGYFAVYAVVGATLFGIGIPLYWMIVVRKQNLASLGITKKRLVLNIGLQVVFSTALYLSVYLETPFPSFEALIPLICLSLCIGLFEAIFWRGWVQMRLEESFGVLPGIVLGSLLYAAYHIGYGMPVSEMTFLFFIGLMFAVVFRLTRNIFILYPFFQPLGQLKTLVNDKLSLPLLASLGFVEAAALMVVLIVLAGRFSRKSKAKSAPLAGELRSDTNLP